MVPEEFEQLQCHKHTLFVLQDTLVYEFRSLQFGGTSFENFYIGPFSGLISLKSMLTDTGINRYEVGPPCVGQDLSFGKKIKGQLLFTFKKLKLWMKKKFI